MGGQIIGVHANAWDNAATGAGGTSAIIDLLEANRVTAFGTTSGASTLTLQVSQNGVNFYNHPTTVAANGNFAQTWDVAVRFVRIHSSAAVTATATIAAKG